MKTIGILGGMGPEATADLYMEIVKIFQKKYGAKFDKDFPPFFIYSLPIPDVVEELENEQLLVPLLAKGVKKLESAGVDFISIACNTVQYYLPQMRQAVKIPILSIPDETARITKKRNYSKVGLLATDLTIKTRIFDEACQKSNIKLIKPNQEQQIILTKVIMNALAGQKSEQDLEQLKTIIKAMKNQGAEAIILGCTDLPLIIQQKDSELKLLDTTKILAQAAVRESRQNLFKQKTISGD
ncbi:MAG: amino acid racemase [Nanoarchaeota archaeon]|nr:amino acid racemase [Nanoarchaeota archaeon]